MQASTDFAFEADQKHWIEQRAAAIANWLQDLIFPPVCGNCGRVDFRFCAGCLRELEQAAVEATAGAWDVASALDGLIATGAHRGILQSAARAFKYEGAVDLAAPLAHRLLIALQSAVWQVDAVVPVPLFADREADRGYNQSALLSRQLTAATGIRSRAECLRRVRNTNQQALLSGADRRENVRDAFEANEDARGLSILLVDDVITTGSTLRECAIALRENGAIAVYGIAVSHA